VFVRKKVLVGGEGVIIFNYTNPYLYVVGRGGGGGGGGYSL